jgi:nucleotide-binding universal stress UspA family protein
VEEEPRRIVAAVDGSANSLKALVRAAEEARAHDGILHVLYAWNYLDQAHLEKFDPGYGEAQAQQWLESLVATTLPEAPPGIRVTVVNDHAARALIDASEGAWTVVIGSRGLGGFRGLLLGSVSQQVVNHAHCAVLVVPGPAGDA